MSGVVSSMSPSLSRFTINMRMGSLPLSSRRHAGTGGRGVDRRVISGFGLILAHGSAEARAAFRGSRARRRHADPAIPVVAADSPDMARLRAMGNLGGILDLLVLGRRPQRQGVPE